MSETVTLALPETVAKRAKETATLTQRRMQDVLLEWLARAANEPPVESLPNAQVLALTELQMDDAQQRELSELLARHREGELDEHAQARLEELMRVYRNGSGA